MTTFTRPQSGRACSPARPASFDKWHIYDALTEGAAQFGIGHRQLAVLRALISFHPKRHWSVTEDALIVFPSNRTLGQRLAGMPDSTLRRHLAALVAAGLVSRHASANGKRFQRGRGADAVAFGFDLMPLVRRFAEIQTAATTARQMAEDRAAERARLLALRSRLARLGHALFDDLSRALRRQLTLADLRNWVRRVRAVLAAADTEETSASNSQNERHIEPSKTIHKKNLCPTGDVTPADIDRICHERRSYFSDALRSWSDVVHAAITLVPMMGLDRATFERAADKAGRVAASVAVLLMLERFDQVRDPGGYLMSMVADPQILHNALAQAQNAGFVS